MFIAIKGYLCCPFDKNLTFFFILDLKTFSIYFINEAFPQITLRQFNAWVMVIFDEGRV